MPRRSASHNKREEESVAVSPRLLSGGSFRPPFVRLAITLCLSVASATTAHAAETLLIKNGLFITMAPGQDEAFVGYMTVNANGVITAVERGEAPASLSADRTIDATDKFVAPGFISAHSHLFTSPLRGLGHTETLYGWGRANSRLNKHATAEDAYWLSLHGSLDFLRNGITTAYDFTLAPTVGGQAVGVGEVVPPPVMRPGPFEENQMRSKIDAGLRFINSVSLPRLGSPEEIIARFDRLFTYAKTTYGDHPLFLKMAISGGLQRAPTKDTAYLEAKVMKKYGVLNQSHFLESPERINEQQEKFYWYEEAGALGPNFIFGHFIQTTPDIVARAAKAGASMSWQPTSNSRLASGAADIPLYRSFGMKVGVGLDDQSCTDISDPFQNLRIGLALIRTKYKDAKALHIRDMLYLHTLGSADILHIADKVGSLEKNKYADFLIVDYRNPDTGPLHDPIATYVLACDLRNLKQVYVGGKLVADGTRMLTFDEKKVRAEVDVRMARMEAAAVAEEQKAAAGVAHPPHPFAVVSASTRQP
ncbi:MAG: amidohydrolase family protein [Opitutus sp.]